LATAEVYISQVSENGFLPICRHRCQSFKLTVQSLYCKLCKGVKQRFFSSMPVLHLHLARMKPCWAVVIIIVYEFLALWSCRTASWHCWIRNCRHENRKNVAPAAKLLAVFCILFLSVLKHRM